MGGAGAEATHLRANFRNLSFWNPTTIPPDEVGKKIHRMDLNECPYPPSPRVLAAIQAAASGLNRYPDGTCPELSARLAARTGTSVEQICWGAGSTQLLSTVVEVAVGPGDDLVAPSIIWRRFHGVFKAADAHVTAVPNRGDGAIDADGLIRSIGNRTRLVVVLTPNNPTGLMLDEDEMARIAEQTPENVLLFVDEAYHEFALHAGGADALEVLKRRRGPWVVTRTFSKAYALAGLRLGYAICSSEEIANALRLVTSTFNVSAVSEAAALAALDDPDYTRMILERNAEERERIAAGFRALGIEPLRSVTNFMVADVGRPAAEVAGAMRERGIRIATLGYEPAGTYIRVSTGFPEDTDAFLTALREILQPEG